MLKRFLHYYKPHLPLFVLDMTAVIVVAIAGLFYPIIAKSIINVYAPEGNLRMILISAAILLALYLVKAACNYIMGYYGHVVGVRMQKDMRRDLFAQYERLPFSYFDDHKTGDLLSRLVNDLFEVSELAHHGPENFLMAALMFIGSFFILIRIDLTLTLILFAVVPFIVLFSVLSRRSMSAAMRNSRRQISSVNSALENSIAGIRETKAYTAQAYELYKFDRENERFALFRGEAMHALGRFEAVMQLLSDLLYLAVILIGGIFLCRGEIDAGGFAAFVLCINMFLTPIQKFVTLFEQLQEGMTGFVRFTEIMDTPTENDTGTHVLSDVRGEIVFDHVSFGYAGADEEHRVIRDLSLTVRAGETLALVGPSGGGKSTLCHLIPRFYEIDEGSIRLDGTDIRDVTLQSLRQQIGIVSQSVFLFDGTIRENIAYGSVQVTDEDVFAAARRANIHDYILSLPEGYDTQVGERGVKLSGGQRQRIAIARVFLKNPRLLILDEATSALDNVTEQQIQHSLEELSQGRTVIVVAHRLSTVKNADEIVVIDGSGIVERGTHGELLAQGGEYSRLYSYQFKETQPIA